MGRLACKCAREWARWCPAGVRKMGPLFKRNMYVCAARAPGAPRPAADDCCTLRDGHEARVELRRRPHVRERPVAVVLHADADAPPEHDEQERACAFPWHV